MHHETKDAHHCCAAIVQLNGALLKLLLISVVVPALITMDYAVAEVTKELSRSGEVAHDAHFQEANEEDNLPEAT